MGEDDAEALKLITEEEAIAALRQMDVGTRGLSTKSLAAQKIFGDWLLQRIEIKPVLAVWWADNVAAGQMVVETIRRQMRSPRTRREEKLELSKRLVEATNVLSQTLERFTNFALASGLLNPGTPKKKALAPDFSEVKIAQVNINVPPNNNTAAP
jgi:hypothetical protein